MNLQSVFGSINRTLGYIEFLRNHQQVGAAHLQRCESILADIACFVDELVETPIPRSANYLRSCIASVLKNIAMTERNIASAHTKDSLELLRLGVAKTAREALLFELDLLAETLQTCSDDAQQWIN
ncbi:MAG TPA: hypothetical protein VGR55_00545 [Candidatus Acidoferrum sp.]|nr:hypothetical protein [Candidatus Acidoferrum sp.]